MSIFDELPKPFFVLAPMDDVTDTVFRQIVASTAPPDLYFTEFVNVDGLQSPGREKLLPKLAVSGKDKPVIAQLWGKKPENYYHIARQLADGSFVEEANWLARRSGLDKVQGSKERGRSRIHNTVTEPQTQLTQQFAKSADGSSGSARKRGGTASVSGGFSGVDLNMGCPVKAVVKNGCCVALINDRSLAVEIIQATQEGAGELPVSVKTRLGFGSVDLSWHELLLGQKLDALTIHGRTAHQLSVAPVDWDNIQNIRELRDKLSPATKIIGNGDIMTRAQGLELAKKYGLDGVMIGRGVFHDPFVFSPASPWAGYDKSKKLALYGDHIELFMNTWTRGERKLHTLNKFCKIYVNGFDGAKELREKLMVAESAENLLKIISTEVKP